MLPNFKEFRCFGSGGKEFFRRRGSADGLFLGGMMRRRVVPVFLFVAAVFAPLLVSADSDLRPSGESYFRQYGEITGSVVGEVFGEFQTRARDKYVFGADASLDFSEWLARHGELTFNEVVVSPLVRGGVGAVEGLGFVRDVEVRYESPLGERAGNFGVAALGSLRESADDVVVWELRGFVGENDVAGANVGAAYRRLVADNFLAGVNAFLDYERGGGTRAGDIADESFWRWSAGVEATGAHLDFSANRYWALSDAVMATVGGEVFRVYSADGWDAELRGRVPLRYPVAFRFLDSAEVAARYYVWEGDGDGTGADGDVSGARYRLGFVPLPQLRFGVEYDDGDDTRVGGGGKNFGYYINFRHRLGGATATALSDDGDDVWHRRFDPVRREHQQHIMRVEATAMDLSLAVDDITVFLTSADSGLPVLTLDVIGGVLPLVYSVESSNPAGALAIADGVVSDSGAVAAGGAGTVVFVVSDAAMMSVTATVKFSDFAVAEDEVAVNVGGLSSGAALWTLSASGGVGSYDYAVDSVSRSDWAGAFSVDSNGVVTDVSALNAGGSGFVVFSVTNGDFVRLVTVRLGDLSLSQTAFGVTLTSDDANAAVITLTATGGDAPLVYAVESADPSSLQNLFSIDSDGVIRDNGAAVAGAATATIIFSVSDAGGFVVRATMTVAVLGDLSFVAGNATVTLNSADSGAVATVIAEGGDESYTYALVSTNPAGAMSSLALSNPATGVITDNGLAVAGAATVSAFVSVMDNFSAMMVTATVAFVVLDDVVFVDDNIRVTLDSDDGGIAVATLTASGGDGNFIYARESAETWLAIDGDGVVNESGAVAAGAATASVVFSATDGEGTKVLATVHFVVLADLAFADDSGSVAVTLNSADANSAVLTLTAVGGWLPRTYRVVSTHPGNWGGGGASLAIAADTDGNGEISDAGLAAAGAATVTAVFAVTDNISAMASATVTVVVSDVVGFVADDLTITVDSTDSGAMVLTLTATGGDGSYTYAAVSGNPSGWENSLAIDSNSGIITDSGAAANRVAQASVVFSATDGNGLVASATVEVIALADLAIAAVDITVSLNSGSVGDAVLTLTASGGAAPLSYAVVSANPAAWMSGGMVAVNNGIVTHNNLATAVGDGTVVFSVTDALGRVVNAEVNFHYTAVKFSARDQHAAAVLNGTMYIIAGNGGGRLNDVWASTDGVNWSQKTAGAEFSARYSPSAAVLGGTLYVIGGDPAVGLSDEVWSSTDGANWTQQATPGFVGRYAHSSAVLGGTLYVIAGLGASFARLSDVWYTTDGTNWTVAVSVGAFASRYEHSSEVLDNALFVMAGSDNSFADINEVWSSTDGATYTQATPAAGFSVRQAPASAVLNGKIYIIGGFATGVGRMNDVYSSADGAAWTQDTSDAGFVARNNHSAVVLNNRIYVMGGTDGTNILNDVWSSADGVNWIQH